MLHYDCMTSSGKESPNMLLYSKMEELIEKMRHSKNGVSIKTVKSLLTKIPDVFSGEDLVNWLMVNVDFEEMDEAVHLGSLMAAHGYFFPIDDHVITLKNDNSFYRFQANHYWPSQGWDPSSLDYAVYLCKRTMQNKARLELADYEAEQLARLQKIYAKDWEMIFSRAEREAKTDRKRDKVERKIHDSQERAFWDVYKPVPGCVNTFEVDIKKAYSYRDKCRRNDYESKGINELASVDGKVESASSLKSTIEHLRNQVNRHCLKMSKVCESLINYTDQQNKYDPMISMIEPSNPWISNDDQFWADAKTKEITNDRVSKWKLSFNELLKDEVGRERFRKSLEKEVSAENLDFYFACKNLKLLSANQVSSTVKQIFDEFLSEDAPNQINIDSKIRNVIIKNMETPDRYCFELAQEHIYHLMKSDSYTRFLKSDLCKNRSSSTPKLSNRGKSTSALFSSSQRVDLD